MEKNSRRSWTGEVSIFGKDYVTIGAAARRLGLTKPQVRRMCDNQEIPSRKHPEHGYRLIPKSYIYQQLGEPK